MSLFDHSPDDIARAGGYGDQESPCARCMNDVLEIDQTAHHEYASNHEAPFSRVVVDGPDDAHAETVGGVADRTKDLGVGATGSIDERGNSRCALGGRALVRDPVPPVTDRGHQELRRPHPSQRKETLDDEEGSRERRFGWGGPGDLEWHQERVEDENSDRRTSRDGERQARKFGNRRVGPGPPVDPEHDVDEGHDEQGQQGRWEELPDVLIGPQGIVEENEGADDRGGDHRDIHEPRTAPAQPVSQDRRSRSPAGRLGEGSGSARLRLATGMNRTSRALFSVHLRHRSLERDELPDVVLEERLPLHERAVLDADGPRPGSRLAPFDCGRHRAGEVGRRVREPSVQAVDDPLSIGRKAGNDWYASRGHRLKEADGRAVRRREADEHGAPKIAGGKRLRVQEAREVNSVEHTQMARQCAQPWRFGSAASDFELPCGLAGRQLCERLDDGVDFDRGACAAGTTEAAVEFRTPAVAKGSRQRRAE